MRTTKIAALLLLGIIGAGSAGCDGAPDEDDVEVVEASGDEKADEVTRGVVIRTRLARAQPFDYDATVETQLAGKRWIGVVLDLGAHASDPKIETVTVAGWVKLDGARQQPELRVYTSLDYGAWTLRAENVPTDDQLAIYGSTLPRPTAKSTRFLIAAHERSDRSGPAAIHVVPSTWEVQP